MNTSWSRIEKFCFRFFCCFFIIYTFPFPLNILQYVLPYDSENPPKLIGWYNELLGFYDSGMHAFIPWIGKHILRLPNPVTIFTNGSGDTTFDYVAMFSFLMLSITGAIIWTILDRKRGSYSAANYWLRVLVRYYLGLIMISYGFYKVYHVQMTSPFLSQLVQPFGDKSPMGLAWSFVGYSKAFSAFTGWGEIIGGFLLFFRRTTTLGSLILVIVLSNIVAINFCYDVPVKLYSSVLLIMSVFLLSPDAGRLWSVLYSNKPTLPVTFMMPLKKRWMNRSRLVLKYLVIVLGIYTTIHSIQKNVKGYGDERTKPHYYGIYNVQYWLRNRDTVQPLTTDTTRWKRLILDFPGYAAVYLMNDSIKYYVFNVDSSFKTVTLNTNADTAHKYKMTISGDSSRLYLEGLLVKDSVRIWFRSQDPNSFRLLNRGFHWVNEFPNNQ
jgi:uncharacterized membrane protein YphA (DoxX/SURF4 family)